MDRPDVWYETLEDALVEIVSACGGPKKVGGALWPYKTVNAARILLLHCLDPERSEKLDMSQLVFVMRQGRLAGCHAAMNFLAKELGYEAPRPVEPETEAQQLQRKFIQAQEDMLHLVQRMERLQSDAQPLKAVS